MISARITLVCFGLLGLFCGLPAALAQEKEAKPAAPAGELKTVKERVSYGFGQDIGRNIARNMKAQELDVDNEALLLGVADAIKGVESKVSDTDMQAALEVFQKDLIAKAKKRRDDEAMKRLEADPELKAKAEKNATAGAAFLKENQAKKGVKVTASGLQYEVLKEGNGKKPAETDVVKTHYHGTLPNGTVFDSSVERKEPAMFPVNRVIEGWTEALQLMPVGSKWRLVIPSKLAYGISGSGEEIGPNQVLIFEVELLGIESTDEDASETEPALEKKP